MSTDALLDQPAEAGLAWITLVLSSGLLGALFVWSLQNPAVLLPSLSTLEQTEDQAASGGIEGTTSSQSVSATNITSETGRTLPDTDLARKTEQPAAAEAPAVQSDKTNQVESSESDETPLKKLRRQELATLPGLAGRVRYNANEDVLAESSDKLLNRMFELLFLYVDSDVVVKISSGDFEDDKKNLELSESRAQKLIAYLVDRGLDEQRFEIVPLGREQLPVGGHRVNVYAKDLQEVR